VLTLLTAFRPGDTELSLAELHRRTGNRQADDPPAARRAGRVGRRRADGDRRPAGYAAVRARPAGAAISITGWIDRLAPDRLAPAVRTAAIGVSRVLRERGRVVAEQPMP
jgi:hypothetical protein